MNASSDRFNLRAPEPGRSLLRFPLRLASAMRRTMAACTTTILLAVAPGAILAQTAPLCCALGRPAVPEEIAGLREGTVMRYGAPRARAFREILGPVEAGKARTTRLGSSGPPTAHVVMLDGRSCCADLGGAEPACLIAVHCSSGEADFALFGPDGAIVGQLNRRETDTRLYPADAIAQPGGDVVTYAHGSFAVRITATGPVSTEFMDAVDVRRGCRLGAGHPRIEAGLAFSWTGQCGTAGSGGRGGGADGPGVVDVLNRDGTVTEVFLHSTPAHRGLGLVGGQLVCSFPREPQTGRVDCFESAGGIPRRARDVDRMSIAVSVPRLDVNDPLVRGQVAETVLKVAGEICGVPLTGREVVLRLVSLTRTWFPPESFALLRVTREGRIVEDVRAPGANILRPRPHGSRVNREADWHEPLAGFIRTRAQLEHEALVRQQIDGTRPMANLMDAMRLSHMDTLLALVDARQGLTNWHPGEFMDAAFRTVNLHQRSNPVAIYLAGQSGSGWRDWIERTRVTGNPESMPVILRIPSAAARRLQPGQSRLRCRLFSFTRGEITLDFAQ